jgi:hypothetical protein
LFETCFGWNFNAIAAVATREEEEGGGMQEGGRRSRHLWTFDSRASLKMYFGQRFHTPMKLQKNAFYS